MDYHTRAFVPQRHIRETARRSNEANQRAFLMHDETSAWAGAFFLLWIVRLCMIPGRVEYTAKSGGEGRGHEAVQI